MSLITDFFAAFIISALAATGVGGGGFFVIYLTLIKNIPQIAAQGINLLFFLCGCVPGIAVHMIKRKINFGVVLLISIFGILGTFLGALLLNILDPTVIRKAFGAMLIITGAISLFRKKKK